MRNIRYQEEQIEFSKQPGTNILIFGSEECPACRRAKPKLKQLESKVNNIGYVELTQGTKVSKLKALPTIMIYKPNKRPVKIEGYNENEILSNL